MTVPHQQAYGHRPVPPPPQRPTIYQVPAPRDSGGMVALRVVTYVLTSLASLLFIVLVIYGYVQLQQARAALDDALRGLQPPSFSAPEIPGQPGG
jgi:hypothetical protein